MQAFPHVYTVDISATPEGAIPTRSVGKVTIEADAPSQFGGPGNRWSPEDLLVAAVADCYALSFRAVAAASELNWETLEVSVDGTLDKVERVTRFTHLEIRARLTCSSAKDEEKALRLLKKSEDICLISNSMTAQRTLHTEFSTA